MSEEEIIEEVEKELKLAKNIDDVATTIRNEYIEGLLDLYNKEKEKNKNSISKDKIKEKMEKLEDIRMENLSTQYYGIVEQCENKIEVLEELLKE